MTTHMKFLTCTLFLIFSIGNVEAQKACCADGKEAVNCKVDVNSANAENEKACCSTKPQATTSGCTPSQCRGAKTKFGEAKVISELRLDLINLKSKMEDHPSFDFTNAAITVHDIVGETDDESLKIIADHLEIIETEILTRSKEKLPAITPDKNKAVLLRQLSTRIKDLSQIL